jgi:hypothetical protein
MKILAIIAAALVVASVSAGTLRSKYKYKEHAEAMHEATKERVEGWQKNREEINEATKERVEGWKKNREEIEEATDRKFRLLEQEREDRYTQRNIDHYDTIPEKLKELHRSENRNMRMALRWAQDSQYKCICKKFKRESLFKINCIKPKRNPCKELTAHATLVREAEQPYRALQKVYKDLSSQMNKSESHNKKIYEKACQDNVASLGRLGFMCKNYKRED